MEDHRRLQCVEIQKVAEASPFVDPSEVVVTHSEVHIADPILSPLGKVNPNIQAKTSKIYQRSLFQRNFGAKI